MADKKMLTLGERAANWAKAMALIIPVLGASIVGAAGWLKGDDAQGDVASLVKQLNDRVGKQEKVINTQSEKLEKMARRMIFFQGHQAGFSSGQLFVKLENTEKQLDQCVSKRTKIGKDELMDLLGQARAGRPQPKAAAPPVQKKIPRLYSKPFRKAK